MNSLNIIVIIFSAILFFFTIAMVNMSSPFAQNEFFPIEGTELAVKHSNLEPDGLYKGTESTATLVLEGTFGNDWGTAVENGKIYLNEYAMTTVGLIVPEAVRVDMETYEKEVLLKNAMIRGKCASGELVVVEGFIMPTNFPKTNSLFKLYCMSDPLNHYDPTGAVVAWLAGGIVGAVGNVAVKFAGDVVTDLMDVSLSELQELVMDREA